MFDPIRESKSSRVRIRPRALPRRIGDELGELRRSLAHLELVEPLSVAAFAAALFGEIRRGHAILMALEV